MAEVGTESIAGEAPPSMGWAEQNEARRKERPPCIFSLGGLLEEEQDAL